MGNLNSTHCNKTFSISYDIWQLVRKTAFDREISIKELVEDIITGKCGPIISEEGVY
jgi:hypothetical protein